MDNKQTKSAQHIDNILTFSELANNDLAKATHLWPEETEILDSLLILYKDVLTEITGLKGDDVVYQYFYINIHRCFCLGSQLAWQGNTVESLNLLSRGIEIAAYSYKIFRKPNLFTKWLEIARLSEADQKKMNDKYFKSKFPENDPVIEPLLTFYNMTRTLGVHANAASLLSIVDEFGNVDTFSFSEIYSKPRKVQAVMLYTLLGYWHIMRVMLHCIGHTNESPDPSIKTMRILSSKLLALYEKSTSQGSDINPAFKTSIEQANNEQS